MKEICQKIVAKPSFEYLIIALILLNALILGLETVPELKQQFGTLLSLASTLILALFILEVIIKLIAVAPQFGKYFGNGWNLFDFSIVVLSLIPLSSEYAMIARLFRLLRVLRLISTIPQLRLIVSTLIRSIPGMAHVMILLLLLFYVYAITGYHLFHQAIPEHWGTLGKSLLTLFTISTLEGWADLLKACMEVTPFAWIYFISFIILSTFIIINLFIAIVLDNMEKAKHETLEEIQEDQDELLGEIEQLENQLKQLRNRLNK
jgi:voltage-gated sodium channel